MSVIVMVFALVGMTAVSAEQEPAHDVVASYLLVQHALASDTLDGVPAALKTLVQQATAMGAAGAPVAKAAQAVAEAKDIKAARTAFGPLSDAVIAVVRAAPAGHEVKLAYCPMADASWLQKEETIRNPYYGSSMLTCGEFRPIAK